MRLEVEKEVCLDEVLDGIMENIEAIGHYPELLKDRPVEYLSEFPQGTRGKGEGDHPCEEEVDEGVIDGIVDLFFKKQGPCGKEGAKG